MDAARRRASTAALAKTPRLRRAAVRVDGVSPALTACRNRLGEAVAVGRRIFTSAARDRAPIRERDMIKRCRWRPLGRVAVFGFPGTAWSPPRFNGGMRQTGANNEVIENVSKAFNETQTDTWSARLQGHLSEKRCRPASPPPRGQPRKSSGVRRRHGRHEGRRGSDRPGAEGEEKAGGTSQEQVPARHRRLLFPARRHHGCRPLQQLLADHYYNKDSLEKPARRERPAGDLAGSLGARPQDRLIGGGAPAATPRPGSPGSPGEFRRLEQLQ